MSETLITVAFGAYLISFFHFGMKLEARLRAKHPEWKLFGGGATRRERLREEEIQRRFSWIIWPCFFAGWIPIHVLLECVL